MNERGELVLSPKFQRRSVWPAAARSSLIDTILQGYPIPPLHVRKARPKDRANSVLEVIDGQQRLRTIFDFVSGGFKLSRTLDATWAGKGFDQLEDDEREKVLDRGLFVFQYSAITDQQVLQIFERFNVNAIPLSAQELRNGKFFGHFKQSSYGLAREYLEFWRSQHIFSDAAIARMLEVEFVSELLVAQLRGPQDKKRTLNDLYEEYDEVWPDRSQYEDSFRVVLDTIASTLGEDLASTPFTKRPLFYTLFVAIYHRLYGLPSFSAPRLSVPFSEQDEEGVRAAVAHWSQVLSTSDEDAEQDGEDVDEGESDEDSRVAFSSLTAAETSFREAASSQTDNIGPREVRLRLFYNSAFRGDESV